MGAVDDRDEEYERELAAVRLEHAWAYVTRAWRDRRRKPIYWRAIVARILTTQERNQPCGRKGA
jgi:hypothetical protein